MAKLEMFVNGNFADGEEVYQIGTKNKDGSGVHGVPELRYMSSKSIDFVCIELLGIYMLKLLTMMLKVLFARLPL